MDASRFHRGWQLLRYFGPKWLMYRAFHAARMKSGLIRWQLPTSTWDDQPLAKFVTDQSLGDPERYAHYRHNQAPRFFFDPRTAGDYRLLLSQWDEGSMLDNPLAKTGVVAQPLSAAQTPITLANDVHRGFVTFFSHDSVEVGYPPRWHADPFSDSHFPADRHWSQIGDFGAGDVKLVWELNRFSFVYPLVRAYWRTGDEQYPELFWKLIESWHAENPPETGVNWKCGQEISLRVMAWCFGLYGFGDSTASSASRLYKLGQLVAASGRRIASNIGYALSQQNNHGLSEAMGLWTIGQLFPEFQDAVHWSKLGRQLLESEALELVYPDGSFSQHSMNYQRVMLHDCLWSMQLGELHARPFSAELRDRICQAGEFVFQLQDESTGQVPCYGQDDGALILPLNNCDYRDYRPIVQATQFFGTGRRQLPSGMWDEDLFWLFGVVKGQRSNPVGLADSTGTCLQTNLSARDDFKAVDGGYQTMRSQQGFALTRAASFRHRPAQADMLHVDIWWRGENIAIDPGTYSYHAPPPWNNSFAHTAFHNTVTVDGVDQMERAGRFLWLPWLHGKSYDQPVSCHGDVTCWNGAHDGYRRLSDPITHRRSLIRLGSDHWLVVDALNGTLPHQFRLHWLLLDAPFIQHSEQHALDLQTAAGQYTVAIAGSMPSSAFTVTRAAVDSAIGWRSKYYHSREPAIAIGLETTAHSVVFATAFGPGIHSPVIEQGAVRLQGPDWDVCVSLNPLNREETPLVKEVHGSGSLLSQCLIGNPREQTIPKSMVYEDSSHTTTPPHSNASLKTEARTCTSC